MILCPHRTFGEGLLILLLCDIKVIDISGMVLAVVQLHYLCVDVGLQGSIVIGQVRERVLLPGSSNQADSLAEAGCTPVTQERKKQIQLHEKKVMSGHHNKIQAPVFA